MDWVPIIFGTFKIVALCTAMFFSIKWHYDQGEKGETRALIRSGAKMVAIFVVALIAVGLVAILLSRMLGLELSY